MKPLFMKSLFTSLVIFLFLISAKAQVGVEIAPDFSVKDVHSNTHHLYEYLDAGKYVVIDFFTTNCGPCQTYASEISASYEHFGCNYGNVIFLGINWGSDNQSVIQFDEQWGAIYPCVSGLHGGGNGVVDLFEVLSYPSVIIIAPDRSILTNYIWPPDMLTINAEVLAAGGIPLICTVDAEQIPAPGNQMLTATNLSRNMIGITCHEELTAGMELMVYSIDGRMVYNNPLESNVTNISLKSGIYFAVLMKNGLRISTVRFIVG
jgi:thiol-disulfide isomerase/thioredoxin